MDIKRYDIYDNWGPKENNESGEFVYYADIKEWQRVLMACMTAFVSIKRLSSEENIRNVADLAIKVIEGLIKSQCP